MSGQTDGRTNNQSAVVKTGSMQASSTKEVTGKVEHAGSLYFLFFSCF